MLSNVGAATGACQHRRPDDRPVAQPMPRAIVSPATMTRGLGSSDGDRQSSLARSPSPLSASSANARSRAERKRSSRRYFLEQRSTIRTSAGGVPAGSGGASSCSTAESRRSIRPTFERAPAGDHFVEHHAGREQIGCRCHHISAQLLGDMYATVPTAWPARRHARHFRRLSGPGRRVRCRSRGS